MVGKTQPSTRVPAPWDQAALGPTLFGVTMATAVLLDATIVRGVLLPAGLTLLGDRLFIARSRSVKNGARDNAILTVRLKIVE
jgi:hypothetical protein